MLLCNITLYTSTMIVSHVNSLNKIAQWLQNNILWLSEFILAQSAVFLKHNCSNFFNFYFICSPSCLVRSEQNALWQLRYILDRLWGQCFSYCSGSVCKCVNKWFFWLLETSNEPRCIGGGWLSHTHLTQWPLPIACQTIRFHAFLSISETYFQDHLPAH